MGHGQIPCEAAAGGCGGHSNKGKRTASPGGQLTFWPTDVALHGAGTLAKQRGTFGEVSGRVGF